MGAFRRTVAAFREQQEEQRRKMQEELEKLKAAADEKHDREVVSFDNSNKDQD